ncbi:hypothetical protein Celal_3254 [Cellulophaga algicola DSM 14237]|uniref:Lipoprotein n=1 Tax=Cellulophaga algicola (strain DSM 14237 / IC166 / ACAM 630) TaxID=688270 RepID=E6X5G8_CELAD|nr:hypothetical protein [Cellulophaga algicola]ADV50523.1 hypothetical protein Celal_3254 [Cellulophaga algicola DSM 14237]
MVKNNYRYSLALFLIFLMSCNINNKDKIIPEKEVLKSIIGTDTNSLPQNLETFPIERTDIWDSIKKTGYKFTNNSLFSEYSCGGETPYYDLGNLNKNKISIISNSGCYDSEWVDLLVYNEHKIISTLLIEQEYYEIDVEGGMNIDLANGTKTTFKLFSNHEIALTSIKIKDSVMSSPKTENFKITPSGNIIKL